MRKDFDDEFDFLDDLEIVDNTKEKKKTEEKPKKTEKVKTEEKAKKTEKIKTEEKAKKTEKVKAEEKTKKPEAVKKAPKKAKKRKKKNPIAAFWAGLCESAAEMSAGDRIVISTGVIVLVMAIVTGSVYLSARSIDSQVAAFAELGEDLSAVSLSGESGLIAVTDAHVAAMNAQIEETVEEETEEAETEKEDENAEDEVIINLTSVQKDLKIKFMNRATSRLISGIPFQVQIKMPGEKTSSFQDDDKDGIIYKTDLTPGSYEVSLVEIAELKDYKFSTAAISVKVKDKIEYKQIDVADEIKTEAQVNVAVEDTAVQKKEEDATPALKDTVEWVESTKTAVGSDGKTDGSGEYEEIDEDDIPDPMQSASGTSRFRMLTQEEELVEEGNETKDTEKEENTTEENKKDETTTEDNKKEENKTEEDKTEDENTDSKEDKPEKEEEKPVAKVTGVSISGASDIKIGGTVSLSAKVEGENLSDSDKGVKWTVSDSSVASISDSGTVKGIKAGKVTVTATSQKDSSKNATCNIEVKQDAVTISLDKSELSMTTGESVTLTAKTSRGSVKWSSDNEKIAKVSDGKVTAVAEGTAVIKATSAEDSNVSATCKVTVKKAATLTVSLDVKELKLFTETEKEIKASVENASGDVSYSFKVKDEKIAEADRDGNKAEIEGLKPGETTVTVTAKDASGAKATAECKVTVVLNPKKDTSTKLKDEDGNQVYILDDDDDYVEAVYADYYTADEFFIKKENVTYKYTGWQTIGGKTYYYTKDGKPVTGEQIIQGAKYVFGSDGALATNSSSGIMGIDVSKWNGTINWTAVKNSGVNYAIIRCGYRGSTTGALIEDPKFKANIQGATAAGIKVGVYFFSQAVNEVEAVEEASMVLNLVKGHKLSYPIFIDVEPSGGRADGLDKNTRTVVVNAFCKTIQNGGYTAGIYANKTWFESKMNTAALSGYKIWLAQYAAAPTYKTTRYDMWQYTSKGKINGINGNVDLNISYLGY